MGRRTVLGVALLLLARRQWRGRPTGDEPAHLPKWLAAIDKITFGKAIGLGFVLSINPKNNATVMTVLLGVIGVVLIGKGIGGL